MAGLLLIGSVVMSSCKKANPASMGATIGGVQKDFVFRTTIQGGVQNVFDGFLIQATTGISLTDGEYVTLLIRGTQVKSYDLAVSLDSIRTQAEVIYKPSGSSSDTTKKTYMGKTGNVTITANDTKNKLVSGTFNFVLVNTKDANDQITVTNGKFTNLSYLNAALPTNIFTNL